ncbi:hypothetical protein PCE1_002771 [Barthelona sp. PCE]
MSILLRFLSKKLSESLANTVDCVFFCVFIALLLPFSKIVHFVLFQAYFVFALFYFTSTRVLKLAKDRSYLLVCSFCHFIVFLYTFFQFCSYFFNITEFPNYYRYSWSAYDFISVISGGFESVFSFFIYLCTLFSIVTYSSLYTTMAVVAKLNKHEATKPSNWYILGVFVRMSDITCDFVIIIMFFFLNFEEDEKNYYGTFILISSFITVFSSSHIIKTLRKGAYEPKMDEDEEYDSSKKKVRIYFILLLFGFLFFDLPIIILFTLSMVCYGFNLTSSEFYYDPTEFPPKEAAISLLSVYFIILISILVITAIVQSVQRAYKKFKHNYEEFIIVEQGKRKKSKGKPSMV